MKKPYFFKVLFAALITAAGAWAQDVIVLRDGGEIQALVVDVGFDAIKYKRWHYQEGPFFLVSVSDVFFIKYRNGEKDIFEAKEKEKPPVLAQQQIPQYTPEVEPTEDIVINKSGKMRVFSVRQETQFGTIGTNLGGTLELGVIGNSGFYFTFEGGGGGIYGGYGFNFGGTINKDGTVKMVLGVTAGYWTNVGLGGTNKDRFSGVSIGGPFLKIMFGRNGNFDITNKWLVGTYEENGYFGDYDYIMSTGASSTYSLSVGWTLTKKR